MCVLVILDVGVMQVPDGENTGTTRVQTSAE
jgi:hypothetical protein